MKAPRVLVAGIGNIFFGDDGFGVEVARRLAARRWPADVRVVDFGIRGMDLAYALMDGPEEAILVDAMPRGGTPGTLYVLEPTLEPGLGAQPQLPSMHGMDPVRVLRMVRHTTGALPRLRVVGCEPSPAADVDEMTSGLSAPVAAAVDNACAVVEGIVLGGAHGEAGRA